MADQLEAILEQIKKYNKIIIHRHQRPDPDAIGSQIGLAEILKASFQNNLMLLVQPTLSHHMAHHLDGDQF